MKLLLKSLFIVLGFTTLFAACIPSKNDANSPVVTSEMGAEIDEMFNVHILQGNRYSLYLGSSLEESWAKLKQVNLVEQLSMISTSDIATYDWSQQKFTLTLEATNRLKENLADKINHISSLQQAFVVTLGEERLYGGVFVEEGSAARVLYPVIYSDFSGDQAIFYLRPSTIHGLVTQYHQIDPALRQRIEVKNVHNLFQKLGKLVE